jgi:NNP family nitrate/nitrite transporter-like MFS transporter
MTFGGFVAFSLFSPTYFNDRWEIPRAQASFIYTTSFVIITALIRPVGGYLSDKVIDARKLLTIVYSVSLVLLGVITVEHSFPVTVGCIYGLGFCCGIGNAAVFKLIPTYFTQVGAVGGLAGAMGGGGGFCMPIIMGRLKDLTGSYTPGFLVWCAICLACLILCLMPRLFARQKI